MSPWGQIYDPHGSWWGTVQPGLASVGMDGLQRKLSIWVQITVCRLHKGTSTMWPGPTIILQKLFSKGSVVQLPWPNTNQNEGIREQKFQENDRPPPLCSWKHPTLQRKRNPWRVWELLFHLGEKKKNIYSTWILKFRERKDENVFCFLPILILSEPQSESNGGKIHYLLNRISFLCQVVNCFK